MTAAEGDPGSGRLREGCDQGERRFGVDDDNLFVGDDVFFVAVWLLAGVSLEDVGARCEGGEMGSVCDRGRVTCSCAEGAGNAWLRGSESGSWSILM